MLSIEQLILAMLGLALCILLDYVQDIRRHFRLKQMVEKYSKGGKPCYRKMNGK
jgi:hypothetical protein